MQFAYFRMSVFSPLEDIAYCHDKIILRIDYLIIESAECFNILWDDGIFDIINKACNSLIDEYEEECLLPRQLHYAIEALNNINKKSLHSYTQAFIDRLINIIVSAKKRDACQVTRAP